MEHVEARRKPNPKRLEKILFVNHKEDLALEKRLESISLTSRLRMMELDRDRINLRNEYRLSKRRRMSSAHQSSDIPTFHVERKLHRRVSFDPVNSYLLSEHRRVGKVIPAILMSLSAKENKSELDFPLPTSEEEQGCVKEEPDLRKIINLVRNVKKLRHDLALNKQLDSHIRLNFRDLMKEIEEREKGTSSLDTYTNGACALFRRKMRKVRTVATPSVSCGQALRPRLTDGQSPWAGFHQYGQHRPYSTMPSKQRDNSLLPPVLPLSRSSTTLRAVCRQPAYATSTMKQQLAEEEELITKTKVTQELENFNRIIGKIGSFMDTCTIDKNSFLPCD